MKVSIAREECIQCGSCEILCDKVFKLPENDKSTIVEKYRTGGNPGEGEVPPELEKCAQTAADACPVTAINTKIS
jgi:ferredoxin